MISTAKMWAKSAKHKNREICPKLHVSETIIGLKNKAYT